MRDSDQKQEVISSVHFERDSPVHLEGYLLFFECVNMFYFLNEKLDKHF